MSMLQPENLDELLPSDDPQWLAGLKSRWSWVKEYFLRSMSDVPPEVIAEESD
jgi:hypothetical protein